MKETADCRAKSTDRNFLAFRNESNFAHRFGSVGKNLKKKTTPQLVERGGAFVAAPEKNKRPATQRNAGRRRADHPGCCSTIWGSGSSVGKFSAVGDARQVGQNFHLSGPVPDKRRGKGKGPPSALTHVVSLRGDRRRATGALPRWDGVHVQEVRAGG